MSLVFFFAFLSFLFLCLCLRVKSPLFLSSSLHTQRKRTCFCCCCCYFIMPTAPKDNPCSEDLAFSFFSVFFFFFASPPPHFHSYHYRRAYFFDYSLFVYVCVGTTASSSHAQFFREVGVTFWECSSVFTPNRQPPSLLYTFLVARCRCHSAVAIGIYNF